MLWVLGGIVVISILSTTRESRAAASERLARWNPLFIAFIIIMLGIVFYPWYRD